MSEQTEHRKWELSDADPCALIEAVAKAGRIMVAMGTDRLRHERLGEIAEVIAKGDGLCIRGELQDAVIYPAKARTVTLDTSTSMKDKIYPRLDFREQDDVRFLSITGLEGEDAFLDCLEGVARRPVTASAPPAETGEPADVPEDDAALVLLDSYHRAETPICIEYRCAGGMQKWSGTIERLMAMGGYVNVIQPGFHLHLEAGLVHDWQTAGDIHQARDKEGALIGLTVSRA